jgi:hypothetical protein
MNLNCVIVLNYFIFNKESLHEQFVYEVLFTVYAHTYKKYIKAAYLNLPTVMF